MNNQLNQTTNQTTTSQANKETTNVLYLSAEERFNKAVKVANKINKKKITDQDLLKVYGLYKQSTIGNCNVKSSPNYLLDIKGYNKWHAWNNCKGKDKITAMNEYADLVIDTADKYGLI